MKKKAKRAQEARLGAMAGHTTHFDAKKYYLLRNFGAERRIIFSSQEDYDRFEAYLYLLNSTDSPRVANYFADGRERNIFETGRGEKLIAIGAYSFTPKDFHVLAAQNIEGGIAKFMQKLQTAYTMYFNRKYAHSGRVFHSTYKARAAESNEKLKYFFAHTHLAAAALFDEHWGDANEAELAQLAANAMKYRYSSAGEYAASKFLITSPEAFPKYFSRTKDAASHVKWWSGYKK